MTLISLSMALLLSMIVPSPYRPTEEIIIIESPSPTTTLHELLNPKIEEPEEEKTIPVCSSSYTKSYMDWSKISETSVQGRFIAANMTIVDGLLYDKDGYIGVALGSYFGPIGSRYIFVLDTGIELKLIKIEAKSDRHTINGCEQSDDHSVIEFVIDSITNKFYIGKNSYIAGGSFNNLPQFKGSIVKIIDKGGN